MTNCLIKTQVKTELERGQSVMKVTISQEEFAKLCLGQPKLEHQNLAS